MPKTYLNHLPHIAGTGAELSQPIMVCRHGGPWTRDEVSRDRGNIYVFTDNTDRDSGDGLVYYRSRYYERYGDGLHALHYPKVTSAVVRGLDNAFPVSTQRWYHDGAKGEAGRWHDADLKEFRMVIEGEFDVIRTEMVNRALSQYRDTPLEVILPENGLTGGRISAITPERTPALYSLLKGQEDTLVFMADLYNLLYCGEFTDKTALIDAIGMIQDETRTDIGGVEELWTEDVESLKFSLLSNAAWFVAEVPEMMNTIMRRLGRDASPAVKNVPLEGLSEPQRMCFRAIQKALSRAGIGLEYVPGQAMEYDDGLDTRKDYLWFSKDDEGFSETFRLAQNGRGIVAAGLREARFPVVHIDPHPFGGGWADALKEGREWLQDRANVPSSFVVHAGKESQYRCYFGTNAREKILSESAFGVSRGAGVAAGVHLAVAMNIGRILDGSIDVEIHPDYAKVDGERTPSQLNSADILIHVLYCAVELDGEIYRVKTTVKEYRGETQQRPYSFEVQSTEILPDGHGKGIAPVPPLANESGSLSVDGAKLLNDIEKSYSPERVLDESDRLSGAISGHFLHNRDFGVTGMKHRVFGWAEGTTVYITPDGLNPGTPIHEYVHLWAKAMQLNNPVGWDSIVSALKGSPVWDYVGGSRAYSVIHRDEDRMAGEVLARLTSISVYNRMEGLAIRSRGDEAEFSSLLERENASLEQFWEWTGKELFNWHSFSSVQEVMDRVFYDLNTGTALGVSLDEREYEIEPTDMKQSNTNEIKGRKPANEWFASLPVPVMQSILEYNTFKAVADTLRDDDGALSPDAEIALDDVLTNLLPGWNDDLSEKESGTLLKEIFFNFPASVSDAVFEHFTQKADKGMTAGTEGIHQQLNSYYNVIMVGVGKHSHSEVLKMFPPDTNFVIDARTTLKYSERWKARSSDSWLNADGFKERLQAETGISAYWRAEDLSFNGEKDIESLSQKPEITDWVDSIESAVNSGHSVVVLYDEGTPSQGRIATGLGQSLARRGMEVGYNTMTADHNIVTLSHESVILGAAHAKGMLDGSVSQIHFHGDGTFFLEDGVRLDEIVLPEERRIRGNWNYGKSFNIDGEEVLPEFTKFDVVGARNSVISSSDIVFVLSMGEAAGKMSAIKHRGGPRCILVPISDDPTSLRDPDYAWERAAACFADIQRQIHFWKTNPSTLHSFDESRIHIGVVGPNEHETSYKRIARAATEYELQNALLKNDDRDLDAFIMSDNRESEDRYGSTASRGDGVAIEDRPADWYDMTGVTENDLQTFMGHFFRAVEEGVSKESLNAERLSEGRGEVFSDYEVESEQFLIEKYLDGASYSPVIGTVFSDCAPGVDRAALLAAQEAGKGFVPILAKNCATVVSMAPSRRESTPVPYIIKEGKSVYTKTYNNYEESQLTLPLGQVQALLLNPFHLGLGKSVSAALSEDERSEALSAAREREGSGAPGLTPVQVRVLQEMKFRNSDINYMVYEAAENGRVIEGATQLAEFLRFCNDHYFFWNSSPEQNMDFSEATITALYEKVMTEVEEGITEDRDRIVSIGDASYPASLKAWRGFTSRHEHIIEGKVLDFVYTEKYKDGSATAEYVPEYIRRQVETVKTHEEAPAVLHYRGDFSLLDSPTVRIAGSSYSPLPESASAVRTAVRHLTQNRVTIVSVMRNGSDMLAVREALDRGAKIVLVSQWPLDYKPAKDLYDEVVEKGGCVISEAAPGTVVRDVVREKIDALLTRPGGEHNEAVRRAISDTVTGAFDATVNEERAEYLATVLGKHLLVIDANASEDQATDLVMPLVQHASNGVSAIAYKHMDGSYTAQKVSGNDRLIADRTAIPIQMTGEGLMDVITKARSLSPQWIESQAEDLSEAKAEAMKAFAPVMAKRDHMVFDVVRSGRDQVFVVPSTMEYVREAVRFTYGEDAVFADTVRSATNMLYGKPVVVDGETIDTFTGYEGTQPQVDLPYVKHLVYYKDVVFSVDNAPDPVMKLTAVERQRERSLFESFRKTVMQLQQDQNIALGITRYKTDEERAAHPHDSGYPAMRFSQGYYTVVTPESVNVYVGSGEHSEADRLAASVFLDSDGRLTVEQRDYDLHLDEGLNFEHEKIFSVSGTRRQGHSMSTVADLAKQLENALFETSSRESEEYMLADREKLAEIAQNIESGFRKVSVSSLDRNAAGAFASDGVTMAEAANDEEVDIPKMVGKLSKTAERFAKKLAALVRDRDRIGREIARLKVDLASSGNNEKAIDQADALVLKEDDLSVVNESILSTRQAIASIQSRQRRLATASFVRLAAASVRDKSIGLCVDGELVVVEDNKVTKKEISEVFAPMVESIRSEESRMDEAFRAAVGKSEGWTRSLSNEDVEVLRRLGRERRLSVPTASENEVVNTLKSGRMVICRDGMYALAARDMRIITPFYSQMSQMGTSQRLLVLTDNGKYNVLNPQGKLMFLNGFDEIRPESEHISAVRKGDEWNHVDFTAQGQLLDEFWSPAVGDFHEGVVRFMGGPEEDENEGKWSFKDKQGKVVGAGVFFDSLTDYHEGKATGRIGDREYTIDKEGDVYDMDGRNVTDELLEGGQDQSKGRDDDNSEGQSF